MISNKVIVIPEGKICDYVDGTFRNDTPEEYVRQTIEKRLINEHKYNRERINIEYTLKLGSRKPRADIAIFPTNCSELTQNNIHIIIECKNETIDHNNNKEGIGQLQSYMSACPNCEWGMWTNGKQKDVFRKNINDKGEIEFLEYNDIPFADGSLEDIDRPKRDKLKKAFEDNLLFVFKTCHNHIYVNEGLQKQPAFFELLKLIFCKIEDEKNIPNQLEFYATSAERNNQDGQLTVKKRISKIFDRVKLKFSNIFDSNDEIKLKARTIAYLVAELQKYSLLNTNIDIKGKAYEELVGANLRGDRGEFFTPRNVMKMTVEMLAPQIDEKVLDSSCGTGGFIVNALTYVISNLEKVMEEQLGKKKDKWNSDELLAYRDRIAEVASNSFFGFDINPDLVKATKMNMVMNNDGSGNILPCNSLDPPHLWSDDFKTKLANALGTTKEKIINSNSIAFFDVIVTNPPFGSKIPVKDSAVLQQFDLGHIWNKDSSGNWIKTKKLQASVPPEQLFIERCLQLLKPGGRMGIVLPDAILGSPGLEYIRTWLIQKAYIIASIDLHEDTFQPRNGTQTSVLFIQKKTQDEIDKEEKSGQMKDYKIFMAMVDRIGHDRRGTTLFKRDKYGNEILVPEENEVVELDQISSGQKTVKVASQTKVIDDQTKEVPKIFAKWKKQEGIGW